MDTNPRAGDLMQTALTSQWREWRWREVWCRGILLEWSPAASLCFALLPSTLSGHTCQEIGHKGVGKDGLEWLEGSAKALYITAFLSIYLFIFIYLFSAQRVCMVWIKHIAQSRTFSKFMNASWSSIVTSALTDYLCTWSRNWKEDVHIQNGKAC